MKKRLLALICVIALLVPLTACSKNKGDTELDREELAGEFLCAALTHDEDKLEDLTHPDLVTYHADFYKDHMDWDPYDAEVLKTEEKGKLTYDERVELENVIKEETGENIKFDKAYTVIVKVKLYTKSESFETSILVVVGECDGNWYGFGV